MDERSQKGIKEYGTTLADNPDGFWRWVSELQSELLDVTLYLQKLKKKQMSKLSKASQAIIKMHKQGYYVSDNGQVFNQKESE